MFFWTFRTCFMRQVLLSCHPKKEVGFNCSIDESSFRFGCEMRPVEARKHVFWDKKIFCRLKTFFLFFLRTHLIHLSEQKLLIIQIHEKFMQKRICDRFSSWTLEQLDAGFISFDIFICPRFYGAPKNRVVVFFEQIKKNSRAWKCCARQIAINLKCFDAFLECFA
jgi:hypothetical protein